MRKLLLYRDQDYNLRMLSAERIELRDGMILTPAADSDEKIHHVIGRVNVTSPPLPRCCE